MAQVPVGRFVWHELMTSDAEAAKAFYKRIFGWETERFPMPEVEYSIWKNGDQGVGGVMQVTPEMAQMGMPTAWMGHISHPDVDATVAEATRRGATVLGGPENTPTVGRWAVLQDPQGAVFAVFASEKGYDATPAQPAVGEFSWHELATTDIDGAFEFYSALFGWTLDVDHDMGPMGVYRIFAHEGRQLGGMYAKPAEMPAPPHWLHYTRVPDADQAAQAVTAGGGTILHGPADVPGGDRVVMALDPQGAAFAIHALAKVTA